MADRNKNSYSPPTENAGELPVHKLSGKFSNTSRIGAGIASVVVFMFAFAGYMAWAIADFYFISVQTHFNAALGAALGLAIIAAYWMFFAIIGHKVIPRTPNVVMLILTGILTVPACVFVLWFFV